MRFGPVASALVYKIERSTEISERRICFSQHIDLLINAAVLNSQILLTTT